MDQEFIVEGIDEQDFRDIVNLIEISSFSVTDHEGWNKYNLLRNKINLILKTISDTDME